MRNPERSPEMQKLGLTLTRTQGHYGKMLFATSPVTQSRVRVYIHGVGADWTFWLPLLPHADRKTSSDTLLLDLPGFGGSHFDASSMSLDLIRDDIFEYIRTAGWTEVDLVGHSMGGFFAIHCAAQPPPELRRVVSISGGYQSIMRIAQQPILSILRSPRIYLLYSGIKWFTRRMPGGCIARIVGESDLLSELAVRPFHSRPLEHGSAKRITRLLPGTPLKEIEAIGISYDMEARWRGIKHPLLAVFGEHDKLVPPSDGSDLRKLSDSFSISVLAGLGHLSVWEDPPRLAHLIDQFLA